MPFTTKLEHWQKAARTMRACFSTALVTYLKETWRRQSKVFSWTILWKGYLMLKVSYGASLEIWLIKRVLQWKISTACTVITAYKVAKSKRRAHRHCQHEEFVTTFWMFGKNAGNFKLRCTPFVRVNTGATENAGMENARPKSDTRKPETDTNYWIQHLTKTYDTYFRSL